MTRVLLLASYCDDDDPACTDDLPCLDCLKMCNLVEMRGPVRENLGGWDFNHDLRLTGEPDREKAKAMLMTRIMADLKADRASRKGKP